MSDEEPVSELETGVELIHRRLGGDRSDIRAILRLIIPWLIKRHRRLS